jgi:hypothetical protein
MLEDDLTQLRLKVKRSHASVATVMNDRERAPARTRDGANGDREINGPITHHQHSRYNHPHSGSVKLADDEGAAKKPAREVVTDRGIAYSTKTDFVPSKKSTGSSHVGTHYLDVQVDAFLEELATELRTKWERSGSPKAESVYGGGGGREG